VAAQTVNGGAVAEVTKQRYPEHPQRIPEAIHDARVKAIVDMVSAMQTAPTEPH